VRLESRVLTSFKKSYVLISIVSDVNLTAFSAPFTQAAENGTNHGMYFLLKKLYVPGWGRR
jgi:hypothetical protein